MDRRDGGLVEQGGTAGVDDLDIFDDAGAEVAVVRYGERVYVNGRVMSFDAPKETS